MTVSIDVAKAYKLNSTIQKDIFRLIELMLEKVSVSALETKVDLSELYDNEIISDQDIKFIEVEDKSEEIVELKTIQVELKQEEPQAVKPELEPDHILEIEPEPEHVEGASRGENAKPAAKVLLKNKAKQTVVGKHKGVMQLPTSGLLKIKHNKSAKKHSPNKFKFSEVEIKPLHDSIIQREDLIAAMPNLQESYVSYDLLPNYEEINSTSKEFSTGSLVDRCMTKAGMLFPANNESNSVVEREVLVSIKGSTLVGEDKFQSMKLKFIT